MSLTEQQLEAFRRDGYIRLDGLFSDEEVSVLRRNVDRAQSSTTTWTSRDREAGQVALALWTQAGDSAYADLYRLPRLVIPARQLLGDDIYHWHSKISFKPPRTGASWHWHQDYGYWFHDGCLTANMLSAMVFIDPAREDNGCLRFLVGAHSEGRFEHDAVDAGTEGKQTGMSLSLVEELRRKYPERSMIGDPGDVVFWHSNLPHASATNRSEHGRLAVIVCYNAMGNDPGPGRGHGKPVPIETASDESLLRART